MTQMLHGSEARVRRQERCGEAAEAGSGAARRALVVAVTGRECAAEVSEEPGVLRVYARGAVQAERHARRQIQVRVMVL